MRQAYTFKLKNDLKRYNNEAIKNELHKEGDRKGKERERREGVVVWF